jgi:hypothetical protein
MYRKLSSESATSAQSDLVSPSLVAIKTSTFPIAIVARYTMKYRIVKANEAIRLHESYALEPLMAAIARVCFALTDLSSDDEGNRKGCEVNR